MAPPFFPSFWIDQTHLQPRRGEDDFEEEKESVEQLSELLEERRSGIPDAVLQGFINRIVNADRLLARVAISDAIAAGGNPRQITRARSELARGDLAVAAGRFAGAINHYREAWKRVSRADDDDRSEDR